MWTGGSEVVEGRDEEPAAKRVRCEQVKLLTVTGETAHCDSHRIDMFTLSSHYISTSFRPKSRT